MAQVDNRNSSSGKRARTDGGRREDDWICPSCGNVNFSFRTTCNMHNCTQSRPADHNMKSALKPLQGIPSFTFPSGYMGSGAPSLMYLSPPPYVPYNSPGLPRYDVPFSGGSPYPYTYGGRFSICGPYGPTHVSGPPPYSGGSLIGTGGVYSMPPLVDRYRFGMAISHGAMDPRLPAYPDESFQKKTAGGGRENDWTCPKCGNNNYSFRTVCNMRKCNTPRPGSQGSVSEDRKGSKSRMPDDSWKCEKCGNINYPFRTKCNRQNCGAEKLSQSESNEPTSNEDDK